MSTTAGTDLEIIEALDFEETKACESKLGCSQEATTLMWMRCCGSSYLLCDEHVRQVVEYVRARGLDHIKCRICDVSPPPYPEFVPLNRGKS